MQQVEALAEKTMRVGKGTTDDRETFLKQMKQKDQLEEDLEAAGIDYEEQPQQEKNVK